MPPVKLYENLSAADANQVRDNKELLALATEDAELEKENNKESAAADGEKSAVGGQPGMTNSKSPVKSLAIKGPPKVINESLEIDNYRGVKVTGIDVKPLVQSVA